MVNYYQKYIKYKTKYLNIKGGAKGRRKQQQKQKEKEKETKEINLPGTFEDIKPQFPFIQPVAGLQTITPQVATWPIITSETIALPTPTEKKIITGNTTKSAINQVRDLGNTANTFLFRVPTNVQQDTNKYNYPYGCQDKSKNIIKINENNYNDVTLKFIQTLYGNDLCKKGKYIYDKYQFCLTNITSYDEYVKFLITEYKPSDNKYLIGVAYNDMIDKNKNFYIHCTPGITGKFKRKTDLQYKEYLEKKINLDEKKLKIIDEDLNKSINELLLLKKLEPMKFDSDNIEDKILEKKMRFDELLEENKTGYQVNKIKYMGEITDIIKRLKDSKRDLQRLKNIENIDIIEKPEDALLRELREESGLNIQVNNIKTKNNNYYYYHEYDNVNDKFICYPEDHEFLENIKLSDDSIKKAVNFIICKDEFDAEDFLKKAIIGENGKYTLDFKTNRFHDMNYYYFDQSKTFSYLSQNISTNDKKNSRKIFSLFAIRIDKLKYIYGVR